MIRRSTRCRDAGDRGGTLVELSLCLFLVTIMTLSAVEFGRFVLVYTAVANAARTGARYAIVHGATRCETPATCGTGIDGPSGPTSNPPQVLAVVKNYASAAVLDPSRLVITVTYPDPFPGNSPGQRVNVTVVYPYDPFTTYFPLRVRLGSTSQGIIAF